MSDAAFVSEDERRWLEKAADGRYSCIDLRFEGGPYVSVLSSLADRGWLNERETGPSYMVSFTLTEQGREALGQSERR